MIFLRWHDDLNRYFGGAWWVLTLLGAALILSGILIVLVPQILVALVAGAVISAGVWFVTMGLSMREVTRRASRYVVHEAPGDQGIPSGSGRFRHVFGGQRMDRW